MEREKKFLKKGFAAFAVVMAFALMFVGCTATQAPEKQETQAQSSTTVSLKITCSGVLDKKDSLPANKKELIPENGVILDLNGVAFTEGENAFEFLQRVCKENNVQMDYSESIMGGSAIKYVTSLGNLAEKDCGNESGWMYKVNGNTPDTGAAEYVLKEGDVVEFYYITSYAEAF